MFIFEKDRKNILVEPFEILLPESSLYQKKMLILLISYQYYSIS